ncbi:hypothetical protein LCGC14_0409070 [marine sediment metagenome]|uniref:Uncharacterized protein n=1 Tax=marine sediment metagenome TaxID=412755 RepID=A0A0F9SUL0_9ZZZZ
MINWCPKCKAYVSTVLHKDKDSLKAKHHLWVCSGCSMILIDKIVKK